MKRPTAGLFIVLAVLANILVAFYIQNEHTIYFWDFNTYYQKYEDVGRILTQDPVNAVRLLRRSVRDEVYNDLPIYPLLPFRLLFGFGRLSFILAIVNLFALPAIWVLSRVWQRFGRASLPIFLAVFLFPFFWDPTLFGYLDVGGLILIHGALWLFLTKEWDRQPVLRLVSIGVLLASATLFRRWYLFWAVGFYATVTLFALGRFFISRDTKRFAREILALVYSVLPAAVLYGGCTWPLPLRMFQSNYADTLSAMRFSRDYMDAIRGAFVHFGAFHIGLFLAGAALALRDIKTRVFAAQLLVLSLIVCVLFYRIQDFDVHQYYLLYPQILLLQAFSVSQLRRAWTRVLYGGLSLFCLFCVFTPALAAPAKMLGPVAPGARHYPQVRHDLGEMKRLSETLARLTSRPDDRIYVDASSERLNSDILKMTEKTFALEKRIGTKILWTHSIDKLERFPAHFLEATYLVVAEPVQYHTRPEDQRVVGAPATQLLEGRGIASHYTRLSEEFRLDDGVRVFLFERKAPLSEDDLAPLREELAADYPDWGDRWMERAGVS